MRSQVGERVNISTYLKLLQEQNSDELKDYCGLPPDQLARLEAWGPELYLSGCNAHLIDPGSAPPEMATKVIYTDVNSLYPGGSGKRQFFHHGSPVALSLSRSLSHFLSHSLSLSFQKTPSTKAPGD